MASRISCDHGAGQAVGRDGAGRVARVDAGLLDVLHDAGHDHLLAVGDGVDVDLDGVFEERSISTGWPWATMKASATNRSNWAVS